MKKVVTHKKRLIAELGDISDAKILDYGCGNGDFIELLLSESIQPKEIFAVDSNKEAIKKIQMDFADYITNGIISAKICTRGSLQEGTEFPTTPLQPFANLGCSQ